MRDLALLLYYRALVKMCLPGFRWLSALAAFAGWAKSVEEMSARAIIGIISICVAIISSIAANMVLFMMIEAIDRRRKDDSLFSDFGYLRLRLLQVLREYRTSYPEGRLHLYGLAAIAAGLIGMIGLFSVGIDSVLTYVRR
jgi:hypothetical protein